MQWRQRVERARYETNLARRRYERVDPDLRLVAAELEHDWEEKLRQQAQLEKEWTLAQSRQLHPLGDGERKLIQSLAADLPALWQTASPADRKRLLRCLIADVTLDAFSAPGFTRILVRWHTGATTTLDVPRPRHGTPPATAVANRLRQLLHAGVYCRQVKGQRFVNLHAAVGAGHGQQHIGKEIPYAERFLTCGAQYL